MGEYNPSLDEKLRFAIPSRLRKAFGEPEFLSLVLAPGFDRCIMAFREDDWRIFVESRIATLSMAEPSNREKMRFLLGGASLCELDRQGRVLIPSSLLDYAGIRDKITVIGVYDRIEIWERDSYDSYRPDPALLDRFAKELGM